jgi:hypothetical protein
MFAVSWVVEAALTKSGVYICVRRILNLIRALCQSLRLTGPQKINLVAGSVY